MKGRNSDARRGGSDRRAADINRPLSEPAAFSPARAVVFTLLGLMVLAVPLVYSRRTPDSARIKLFIHHLCIAASLAVIVWHAAWTGALRLRFRAMHAAVLLYFAVVAASLLVTDYPLATRNEVWRVFMLLGTYAVTIYALRTPRAIKALLALCVLATLAVCFYGVMQKAGLDPTPYDRDPQQRVFASLGNPNLLAGFLLLMIWLIVGMLLDLRDAWLRGCLGAVLLLALCIMTFTLSRAAWIALGLSGLTFIVWMIVGRRFPVSIPRRRGLAIGGACLLLIAVGAAVFHGPVLDRLSDLRADGQWGESARTRLTFWRASRELIAEKPVLGYGAGTWQIVFPDKRSTDLWERSPRFNARHAHSEPMEIAVENGIVGLAAFGLLAGAFYVGAFRTLRQATAFRGVLAGIVLGVTALLLHNAVDVGLRWYALPAFLWMFLGMSVAIGEINTSAESSGRECSVRLPLPLALRMVLAVAVIAGLGLLTHRYVSRSFFAEVHVRSAKNAIKRARYGLASEHAMRAAAYDPSNLEAHYVATNALTKLDRNDEAFEACLQVERLAPHYCELQHNLGVFCCMRGDYEAAARHFAEADRLGVSPDGFSSSEYMEKSRAERARVVRGEPPFDDVATWTKRGMRYLRQGKADEAERCLKQALEADPTFRPAMNNLAGVYFQMERFDEAVVICRDILRVTPDDHQARVHLGLALYQTGDREGAVKEWQEVLRRDPDNADADNYLKQAGPVRPR